MKKNENKNTATTATKKKSPVGTAVKVFILVLLAGDILSLVISLVGRLAYGILPSLSNAAIAIAIGALACVVVTRTSKQASANADKKAHPVKTILKGILAFAVASVLTVLLIKVGGQVLVWVFNATLKVLPIAILFVAGYMAVSRFFKSQEDNNHANRCPSTTMDEWRRREAKAQEISQAKKSSTEQVSREVAMLRAKMAPDINVCLSSAAVTWDWASATSADRIYVRHDENPNGYFQGHLTVVDCRVTEVAVPLTATQVQRYPNTPLLAAQKAEKEAAKAAAAAKAKAEQDAFSDALLAFFGTRRGGERARFSNLNPAKKSFTLTAPLGKVSVKDAKAVAEVKDGSVVAINVTLPDGAKRTIKRGKQGALAPTQPKKNEPKPAPAPSKVEPEAPADPESEAPAPVPPAPVEGMREPGTDMEQKDTSPAAQSGGDGQAPSPAQSAEEAPFKPAEPVDIHQPSGLDKDALERHVRLFADDAGKVINDVAVTAYNAGQEYCFVGWPEGLLTLEEVEAFAQILTTDYNFSDYEILENSRQVKLRLGMVNSGSGNSLETLVADMIPDLEATAAQQLFEDGEEWTTINWPPEVDSIKAANEFARYLLSKSNFDNYSVSPTGQIRLHMAAEDEF